MTTVFAVGAVLLLDDGKRDTPSGSFTAASESEAREMIASMQMQSEKFNVGSTPHVEIFGPEGNAVARDNGSDKSGYELLQEWIAAES